MRTSSALVGDVVLEVPGPGAGPLHERLKRSLRAAIRSGRLPVGAAVPPSRQLALDLGVSRSTVTEAYGQLLAEGYLTARPGSATRVRWAGPGGGGPPDRVDRPPAQPRFDLAPGLPDLRAFPRQAWADALRAEAARAPFTDLGYPDAEGHPRLRAVLGQHLERSRAVSLDGATVAVRTSATAGVRQTCRELLAAGVRTVAVEDPGWTRLHRAVEREGLRVVGVPVDEQGLRVDVLDGLPQPVRAVLVTPAHQFPTGVVLSPARRSALLAWADRVDGLVIEDDYDAEFRYDRAPVATLQGMRPDRVVLVGSLSKTLSPALGIGWRVAPTRRGAGRRGDGPGAGDPAVAGPGAVPPTLDQLALARLLETGRYDRHLRASRRRYRTRRDALVAALRAALPGSTVSGVAAGLHLLLHLPQGPAVPARDVAAAAARGGLAISTLGDYTAGGAADGLVLGYGDLADGDVPGAVAALAAAVRQCQPSREASASPRATPDR